MKSCPVSEETLGALVKGTSQVEPSAPVKGVTETGGPVKTG